MSAAELKSNIHKIVDNIQSEQLLQSLHYFLKTRAVKETDGIWNSLTDEQRQEVLLALDESEDESQLVDVQIFGKSKS
jgi:hypothetical protein